MLHSLDDLLNRAQKFNQPKKVAIASAEDIFVLRAIEKISKLGLIAPIFIGDHSKIEKLILENKLLLPTDNIIDVKDQVEAADTAIKLIRKGDAHILMKGLISTRILLKAVLNKNSGIAKAGVLSHLALFKSPHKNKVFGITDAAINIAPDVPTKIRILQSAVEAYHTLGYRKPKVALLAAVEKVNPKMKDTVDAAEIVRLHQNNEFCNAVIHGPLALDIAISKTAAKHKGVKSPVSGSADLLLVPEITAGNVLYKSLTYLGGAVTAGVVLGAQVPVVLTSRSDSDKNKLFSIALALNLCK